MWHKSFFFFRRAVPYCKKAFDLYCDFKEVKDIVDSFLEDDYSDKKKYSNFLYLIIQEISHLQKQLEIRTKERNYAIENAKKSKFFFWLFGSIGCFVSFIIGFLWKHFL